jgi:arylsulfatase A-like enzyme
MKHPVTRWLLAFGLLIIPALALAETSQRPNVVLIITDDQGYGDIGAHGNTMIKTPSLDALAKQSTRLTNFHVDPTCAETRSALMTGRYSCRTGVWHTIMGRSILRRDEATMPQLLESAGYRTGMFGKWHLGDSYPYRPMDRGFQESLVLAGGGVGQSPDHWGNDYFDDTYLRNGKPEPQKGYCTDVFFDGAKKFIKQSQESAENRPFFCYIATNAPHSPYNVDPALAKVYLDQGVPQPMANFYAMISNIDENVGKLLAYLEEQKLSDNTIVVFMTDNGTAEGAGRGARPAAKAKGKNAKATDTESEPKWTGFTAGMRASKGSQYDGGHRVPCFIRWPGGKLPVDHEVSELTAHFDLLPSLLKWCDIEKPASLALDGQPLDALVRGTSKDGFADRTIVVHSQRVEFPEKHRKTAVIHGPWRLIDNSELYNIADDPGQTKNIAADHPAEIEKLRKFYEGWWLSVSTKFGEYVSLVLGADASPSVDLCCHDWHPGTESIPWNQSGQIGVAGDPFQNGFWAVDVAQAGTYRFLLHSRPAWVKEPLKALRAKVKIGDNEKVIDIDPKSHEAVIEFELQPGETKLWTYLEHENGKSRGAYYVTVERVK